MCVIVEILEGGEGARTINMPISLKVQARPPLDHRLAIGSTALGHSIQCGGGGGGGQNY